jgi:type IV pilus assembly protein PilB
MSVVHGGRKIDLRVATLPTVCGEKIVMRILDNSTRRLDCATCSTCSTQRRGVPPVVHEAVRHDPGHRPDRFRQVDDALHDPARCRRPEINVITVEDPVEYRMDGINQVQVNPKAGSRSRRAAVDPAVRPRRRAAR